MTRLLAFVAALFLAAPAFAQIGGNGVNGGGLTAPSISGTVTGTYTLGGTPTLNSALAFGASGSLTAPVFSGTTTGTYTLGGTATITAPTIGTSLAFATVADSSTAPTIASGGCTTGSTQSIAASNGTTAFEITLGGATCGSTITLTLPAATTHRHCTAHDITTPSSNEVHQTAAASATSVVLTNFVRTTGIAGNFTGADHLLVSCRGY